MTDILDGPAIPPPSPSELDELISRDPLQLSAMDIDKIIAYQRQQRAKREAGEGRKRKAADPDAPKIDLAAALGLVKPPMAITPPKAGGFRRL